MWIRCTNEATERLKSPEMDEAVSISDNGTAQVSEDVGESLVERLDAIERYDKGTDNE
jgi:hypothetical protein